MKAVLVVASLTLAITPIGAQNAPDRHDSRPVVLLPGLGHHHHPILTTNLEAQKFFDQGLILVYGFNRAEAIRSFRRAAELDPQSPMPYWGIALAHGYHLNMDFDKDVHASAAYEAIQKAIALNSHAPANEQEYVAALTRRCAADPRADEKKLSLDYKNAMEQVAAHYPDDTDAGTLYAESWMDLDRFDWYDSGNPKPGTEEIALLLESVFRREPEHPGANHLYVHLMDDSLHPERALTSAYRLAQLAPGAGHLMHMGGHIFWKFGDYETAAHVNERAVQADAEYVRLTGVTDSVYAQAYYSHNMHFVSRSNAELGRFEEAKKWADVLAQHVLPAYSDMPGMVDCFLSNPFLVLLRFGRWDEVLQYPKPDPHMGMSIALWHYARAVALAGKGNRPAALEEKAAFEKSRAGVPATTEFFMNPPGKVTDVAAAVLEARLAKGNGDEILLWEKAVALQDGLMQDDPPAWDFPVRESLAAALLRSGRVAAAEAMFREDLQHNPRNPRGLFGLWQSLEAQHKTVAASWVQKQFEDAWKNADSQLHIDDF